MVRPAVGLASVVMASASLAVKYITIYSCVNLYPAAARPAPGRASARSPRGHDGGDSPPQVGKESPSRERRRGANSTFLKSITPDRAWQAGCKPSKDKRRNVPAMQAKPKI